MMKRGTEVAGPANQIQREELHLGSGRARTPTVVPARGYSDEAMKNFWMNGIGSPKGQTGHVRDQKGPAALRGKGWTWMSMRSSCGGERPGWGR